jgi:hypothetical protein
MHQRVVIGSRVLGANMRVGDTAVCWEEWIHQATLMHYFATTFYFCIGCKHVYCVGMGRGELQSWGVRCELKV